MTQGLLASEQSLEQELEPARIRGVVEAALAPFAPLRRVLLLHPDYSRTDFTHTLFGMIYATLAARGLQRIDTLNAAGTHRAMTLEEKMAKLGIADRAAFPALGELADHSVAPSELVEAGTLPAAFMGEKTQGRWAEAIPIKVNRRLREPYDLIIGISGTVPHEAAGYAGGTKVLFPGVSGREVINGLHWAAVQMGIPKLIGRVDNPGRDVINAGAKQIFASIPTPMLSFNMLFEEIGHTVSPRGLYAGTGYDGFVAAFLAAAAASAKLHILRVDAPLDFVVQELGEGYDEVWTGGKGSYKLQSPGVLSPGAEVVLYQPKIHCFHSSAAMDRDIRALGYHGLDYVLHRLEQDPKIDRNVASHVVNVRGPATYDRATGKEEFAFQVTLATAIPQAECRAAGLGYRDPASLREAFAKASGNKLWIENGGKMLYARTGA